MLNHVYPLNQTIIADRAVPASTDRGLPGFARSLMIANYGK